MGIWHGEYPGSSAKSRWPLALVYDYGSFKRGVVGIWSSNAESSLNPSANPISLCSSLPLFMLTLWTTWKHKTLFKSCLHQFHGNDILLEDVTILPVIGDHQQAPYHPRSADVGCHKYSGMLDCSCTKS